MKTLILVDYSHALNRFFYGYSQRPDAYVLKDGEKVFIGSLLGFTSLVEKITNKYPEAKIIFCMDGKAEKKELNEDYKAGRDNSKKEQIYSDDSIIVNILSHIKNVCFAKNKIKEADDLIANIAFKFKDKFDEIVIYSGDKDFIQLSTDFKISNEFDKGFKFVTDNIIFEKFGVSAKSLLPFRVLEGDKSDNIPSPVPYTKSEFRKVLAEMWNPLTEEHLVNCLELLKGTQYDKSAEKHLLATDKIMNNLALMDLRKYANQELRFEYELFKCNKPDLSLVNYFGLRKYESFLYDYLKGNKVNV